MKYLDEKRGNGHEAESENSLSENATPEAQSVAGKGGDDEPAADTVTATSLSLVDADQDAHPDDNGVDPYNTGVFESLGVWSSNRK